MVANTIYEEKDEFKLKTIELSTFIDLCAGIGGGRIGMTNNGLKCVAYSEIDKAPVETYKLFYGDEEKNYGDLMKINPDFLPDFDLLIGGFPCQTFSIVGKREGFKDDRGQIIYGIAKILEKKQTPCFILENVKGLLSHNKGKTLISILKLLTDLNYNIKYAILDSQDYGVPQMRERIYFVGIHNSIKHKPFEFPKSQISKPLSEYLIDTESEILPLNNPTFQKYLNNKYNINRIDIDNILAKDYTIIDTRQSDLRVYTTKCPTLRTGRHGILYTKNRQLHKLSELEALLLQGFPHELAQKVKTSGLLKTKILSQAGNAMTVNVMDLLCKELIKCLDV